MWARPGRCGRNVSLAGPGSCEHTQPGPACVSTHSPARHMRTSPTRRTASLWFTSWRAKASRLGALRPGFIVRPGLNSTLQHSAASVRAGWIGGGLDSRPAGASQAQSESVGHGTGHWPAPPPPLQQVCPRLGWLGRPAHRGPAIRFASRRRPAIHFTSRVGPRRGPDERRGYRGGGDGLPRRPWRRGPGGPPRRRPHAPRRSPPRRTWPGRSTAGRQRDAPRTRPPDVRQEGRRKLVGAWRLRVTHRNVIVGGWRGRGNRWKERAWEGE
jgi:hypothetical protein